jgi:hypothetical protein
MADVRLRISPPWITYINYLEALFDGDPQIAFNVNYSAENPSVTLATNNPDKAAALAKLLPEEKWFGNIALKITIDCNTMSNCAFVSAKELFETAFSGNPAFAYVVVPENVYYIAFTYVVFKNCVVQFFNDNLNDPHGVISTLYQDIAEIVFADMQYPKDGVAFCTDVERKLGIPTSEWVR